MKKAYPFKELVAVLGNPSDTGPWLGDFPLSPVMKLLQAPPEPGRYMMWSCTDRDSDGTCVAISPHDQKSTDEWFVVQVCPRHDGTLAVTPYQELSAAAPFSASDEPRMLVAITHHDFENKTGHDWESIVAALEHGWIVSLVTEDARFAKYYFLIMERPDMRAHPHDIRGVPHRE